MVIALATVASGCALLNPDTPDAIPTDGLSAEQRQAELLRITDWRLQGRIALRSGEEGANASLVWTQQGDDTEVRLFGAFGLGAVRLVQGQQDAALYRSGHKPLYGENAEQLLRWETGMRIPLKSLGYWVRGLPGNGEDLSYDSYGRLRSLQYVDDFGAQWAATFERYREVNGHQLPVRVRVEGSDYLIRLTVERWTTEAADSAPADTQRLRIPGVSS
jgi:outer membrane lipoprotein LolB